MQIIKDRQIVDDNWTFFGDADQVTGDKVCVSLNRWQTEKAQLLQHPGKLAIRIQPADDVRILADGLDSIDMIEVEFPVFTDGRGFSHARLLRSALNYQGELRAVGTFLPDQVFYLSRVGFNAFQLADTKQIPLALSTLNDFSVHYQASTQ